MIITVKVGCPASKPFSHKCVKTSKWDWEACLNITVFPWFNKNKTKTSFIKIRKILRVAEECETSPMAPNYEIQPKYVPYYFLFAWDSIDQVKPIKLLNYSSSVCPAAWSVYWKCPVLFLQPHKIKTGQQDCEYWRKATLARRRQTH